MQPYRHAEIETQAQHHWEDSKAFEAIERPDREKFYCLSMFPYPSGKLHMGHVRNYTIGDVLTRYHRMNGKNVLQPMGWDAFGLPAENAAMANAVPPAKWTYENIAYMKIQLRSLGFAIDWKRELATCNPDYYRWNQWFFLRMRDKGIAYKKTQVVNWDPVDQTVLANEQVIDGRGWRTGALVEKREIPGYYLAITRYAEELLADLDQLPGWPERVKAMQANWIGKSEGVRFAFPYTLPTDGNASHLPPGKVGELAPGQSGQLWVFTTRADTIMGVTFCAVAAEHPLAAYAARNNPALAAFLSECKQGSIMEADMATMEKKGLPTGLTVTHPLTGQAVPVWVGNYVLMGYGEGAVMAVPAHDERDFHFAKKYELPIKQVIGRPFFEIRDYEPGTSIPNGKVTSSSRFDETRWQEWYADKHNSFCVNSGKYDGLAYREAVAAIAADLKSKGLGDTQVQWRLRDWGISRQRFWGCPIPLIHCEHCGEVPVPDADLPVKLPEDCVPDGSGNPLAKRADFVQCSCPSCGRPARRETDTMDTFVDSSWYYSRFASHDNHGAMVDARVKHWLPVDQYIGGIEHAILHLLYSRFWTKVMRDEGLVDFDEPFTKLLTQGMVLNHIFSRRGEKGGISYFAPEEVDLQRDAEGHITGVTAKSDGQAVDYGGVGTMSKSKRNGVDPQALIEQYGADTARLFVMFASHPEQTLEWSDAGVDGAYRFLKRLWAFAQGAASRLGAAPQAVDWSQANETVRDARRDLHKHLAQANYDYTRLQFNTVVSAGYKMLNTLEAAPQDASSATTELLREGLSMLLRVLNPVVPHITHALWVQLGFAARHGELIDALWPQVDEAALVQEVLTLVLQINGKTRGQIEVPAQADQAAIEAAAIASPEFQRHAAGKAPRKVVVVPGRLVNVVA